MANKLLIFSALVLLVGYYYRSDSSKNAKIFREGIIIQAASGPVKGSIRVSRDGRDYFTWHKIPFAKPPIGDLRFSDPQPPGTWRDVIDGREVGPSCPQVNMWHFRLPDEFVGDEDCLHLNVFVPKTLYQDIMERNSPKLPVIVYIHGGGFVGSGSDMFDPTYFMDEDVLAVSTNYRLEILGFLTTGDSEVRGNMGLKDQSMALKWVQENIQYFGGDPTQVTIFGGSAGAASVHMHMLSAVSKGLFHKVFAQSGAAPAAWSHISLEKSLKKTKEVAKVLNCPTDSSRVLIGCLRNVTLKELMQTRLLLKTDWYAAKPHLEEEPFVPTIEVVNDSNAFLTEDPMKTILEGKATRVPLLIGHTTHEGLSTASSFIRDPTLIQKYEAVKFPALKRDFGIRASNWEEVVAKIHDHYFPPHRNQAGISMDEKIASYINLFSDAHFNLDIQETVLHQRKFSPVYYYMHNKTDFLDPFRMGFFITGKWPILVELGLYLIRTFILETLLRFSPKSYGINHAADVFYYQPFMGVTFPKEHAMYEYSKDLVRFVVDFARDDTKLEFRGLKFPAAQKDGELQVFEFKNDHAEIMPAPFQKRLQFLRTLNIR